MSSQILKIKSPIYLIKFYETICGEQPFKFENGLKKRFHKFLHHYLDIPPLQFIPYEDSADVMKIQLPCFKDKDIRLYSYLSPLNERLLVRGMDDYFKQLFYDEATKLYNNDFRRKDLIIYYFMEKYNIPVDFEDMLFRDLRRYRNIRYQSRLKKLILNKSTFEPEKIAPSEV